MQISQLRHKNRKSQGNLECIKGLSSLNTFKLTNVDLNSFDDIEKKALQCLLDIQYDNTFETKNPEADFMSLTRNIQLNRFPKRFDIFGNNFKENNQERFMMTRNKFNRTKSHLKSDSIVLNNLLDPAKIDTSNDSQQSIPKNTNFSNQNMQNIFAKTKSNLLTPRKSFPAICTADHQYIALTRKTRSGLKPYSMQKIQQKIRITSIIKLREQLSLLPRIQKQLKKKRMIGYD